MIILDNSVISAFCEIGRFELLREILYKLNLRAIIPTTVLKEIIFDDSLLAITTGKTYSDKWIKVVPVNNYAAYLPSLHPGEAGVIALAKQMNGIAALDDLDARKVSRKENIRLTGTLGILKTGYELCPVKDMLGMLDKMVEAIEHYETGCKYADRGSFEKAADEFMKGYSALGGTTW